MLPETRSTHSQVVLGVPKSCLNGDTVGLPSWGCAPGFPWLPVPAWARQAHSWHCPCFWVLKVHQLYSLLSWRAASAGKGPHFWQGVSLSAPGPLQAPPSWLPHGKTFRDMDPLLCSVRRVCNTAKKVQVCWWWVIWPWPERLYELQILSECSFLENWVFVATVSLCPL